MGLFIKSEIQFDLPGHGGEFALGILQEFMQAALEDVLDGSVALIIARRSRLGRQRYDEFRVCSAEPLPRIRQ